MSNPITKLSANELPGIVFNSAIGPDNTLVIESRTTEETFFSFYELSSGELVNTLQSIGLTPWHTLIGVDEKGLILSYFKNKQNPDNVNYIHYDPKSDEILDSVEPNVINQNTPKLPSLFQTISEHFKTVEQFIGERIVLGCEYEEIKDIIIISYYLEKRDGFERKLLVLKNGKIVVHEVQDEIMSGFATGAFFTVNNRLIFVKEKNEINIYEI